MDKLNIEKINTLLLKQNKSQKQFSIHIGLKESSLSQALNGKRPFPFAYIFKIAKFFNLENPYDLVESITTKENNNKPHNKKVTG